MSQTQPHADPRDTVHDVLERARSRLDDEGDGDVLTDETFTDLVDEADHALYDGAPTEEVYEAVIDALTARIERDPAYKRAAAEVFLQKYFREVAGKDCTGFERDRLYRETFRENVAAMVERDILDERMTERFDLERLADSLEPDRDEKFEYMALDTLYQRYFLKTADDERMELPQAFWMRVAMGLALEEDEPNERAEEFYDVLSKLEFTPSSPTLFHAGTTHPQLSSCYLTTVSDDLEGIFDAYKEHATLSKWSGGLGNDWTNVRAAGARISSTGVESTGTVPFLRISNDVTGAINRSGKRRGAAAAYLAAWHADYPDFLDLKRNTGDERRRTPDMNTAAWVPDLFMERVQADEEWTLFSPDEVPELHETYGEEFREHYEAYEEAAQNGEIDEYEVVEAADLWRKTLTRLFETGHPWITFKDPCNVRSPQDHAGTIHSSNLCTEITLNTSQEETAVCNLGSVNYETHVDETAGELDRERLADTIETAMRMLDNVVDLCFYPTEKAERSNMRHRPIGLGSMGFHAALMECGIPMNGDEAIEKANRWQEFVSYHAILNSARLAGERGAYDSYEGSKWDRGILPQDTVDLLEEERGREIPTDREETMDWFVVREAIAEHGMRNSNTMAIAPTATVSTINGTSPSIEPIYSNLYVKSNMSGDFTVINDRLVEDLKAEGLWTEEIRDRIKYHDGSIQELEAVPDDLKELYRGAFEIDPRHQLDLTAYRGTWIDQSVSHNVFFPSTDGSLLDDVYTRAWEMGVKTTYYLRTLGASQIEKSTLDMDEYGKTQHRGDDDAEAATDGGRAGDTDETDLCAVEDPTCDACQ
ncbi:ribonucleoside-diphosphate reductase subunit alpha [Halarchaeum salinum]|uniref:Vitamin B12-dependent ribonucleotide reductase n=1 Tax=Halarchaeum salinum TaxID=489912 RepID=A0AAV3S3H8_9EURY